MAAIDNIIRKLRMLDEEAANYVRQQYDAGMIPDYKIQDDPYAITYLFCWDDQPQPERYWNDLYIKYIKLPNQIITKLGNTL